MFRLLLWLEWKSFFRSKAFAANLVIKIVIGLFALYMAVCFGILSAASYFILKEEGLEPISTVNKYMVGLLAIDLIFRYFMQKLPVVSLKPLLLTPLKKNQIVTGALTKSVLSFFNFYPAFLILPFTIVLLIETDINPVNIMLWHIGIFALYLSNNFINLLINNKDKWFYPVVGILMLCGMSIYYGWFDVTEYTAPFFEALMNTYYAVLIPIFLLAILIYITFKYFKGRLNLDTTFVAPDTKVTSENLNFLNKYGIIGSFIKNDVRLLLRNKRSKTTLFMSVLFIFYGLLFFTDMLEIYSGMGWRVFASVFVTAGFIFTFGQFVPSWDSAYYQLMMSQNIPYRKYLEAKWWLMNLAAAVSMIIASFYIFFGWETFALIVVGCIFNIGVNSYLVLWAGAYVKTPIDLESSQQAFGNKQAFNIKTLLISLPKMLVPIALFYIGKLIYGNELGIALIALAGIVGFAFRNKVFDMIEKIYKTEKYETIAAYKEKP